MSSARLFAQAFEEGCGIGLREAMRSPRYRELKKAAHAACRSADRGEANRAAKGNQGVTLIATALLRDRKPPAGLPSWELSNRLLRERALLQLLGESLLEAATRALPAKAARLAQEWRQTPTAQERADVLCRTYNVLVACHNAGIRRRQRREGTTDRTEEVAPVQWLEEIEGSYSAEDVLPLQWEPFGYGQHPPSCLGMAIMLAAWAKLAGAPSMLACLVEHQLEAVWASEERVGSLLLADLAGRGLAEDQDNEFMGSLRESLASAALQRHRVTDFHAALAVEVGQGCWFYLDPYILSFGQLGEEWKALEIDYGLRYAYSAAPGVTLVGHDGGRLRRWLGSRRRQLRQALRHSHALQESLSPPPAKWEEFVDLLNRSPEMGRLSRLLDAISRARGEGGIRRSPLQAYLLAAYGVDRPEPEQRHLDDYARPESRQKCLNRLLGTFHWAALSLYDLALENREHTHRILPVALEFANTEYGLAVLAMHNLGLWSPVGRLPPYWGVRHSASQVFWHDAVHPDGPAGTGSQALDNLLRLQEKVVRSSPRLHRRCRNKLAALHVRRRKR